MNCIHFSKTRFNRAYVHLYNFNVIFADGHNMTLESASSFGGVSSRRRALNGLADDEIEERQAKMLEAQVRR